MSVKFERQIYDIIKLQLVFFFFSMMKNFFLCIFINGHNGLPYSLQLIYIHTSFFPHYVRLPFFSFLHGFISADPSTKTQQPTCPRRETQKGEEDEVFPIKR